MITSPTGAAIRDIITTIKRRYPIGNVIVFPVLVQGESAAPSIVQAIRTANEMGEIDVLIVGVVEVLLRNYGLSMRKWLQEQSLRVKFLLFRQ